MLAAAIRRAPTVEIIDPTGKGRGAEATADITGGTAIVELARWPYSTHRCRPLLCLQTDGDGLCVHRHHQPLVFMGAVLCRPVHGFSAGVDSGHSRQKQYWRWILLSSTNQITLDSLPATPLAVGMTVTAPTGIPAQTTILKIVGTTVYLSQIPAANHADEPAIYIRPAAGAFPSTRRRRCTRRRTRSRSAARTRQPPHCSRDPFMNRWRSRPLPFRLPRIFPQR